MIGVKYVAIDNMKEINWNFMVNVISKASKSFWCKIANALTRLKSGVFLAWWQYSANMFSYSKKKIKSWLSCYKKAIWGTWRIHSFIQKTVGFRTLIGSRIIIWALEKGGRTLSTKQHNSEDDEMRYEWGSHICIQKKGWREKRAIELHLTKPSFICLLIIYK